MKKSRFTDSQIMSILKSTEAGTPVAELCREYGMSHASFYKWCSRFGGMDASMMVRLKERADENHCLKRCMSRSVSKTRSLRRRWQKSGEAIGSKADGTGRCQ
jgi:putative transposase